MPWCHVCEEQEVYGYFGFSLINVRMPWCDCGRTRSLWIAPLVNVRRPWCDFCGRTRSLWIDPWSMYEGHGGRTRSSWLLWIFPQYIYLTLF
jgi:hypothetical protein